jgi:hypothetical protein
VNNSVSPTLDGWIPDEEPQPAVTDCWAQGAVPKIVAARRQSTLLEGTTGGSGGVSSRSQSQASGRLQCISESVNHAEQPSDAELSKDSAKPDLSAATTADYLLDDTTLVTEADGTTAAVDDGRVFRLPDVPDLAALLPSNTLGRGAEASEQHQHDGDTLLNQPAHDATIAKVSETSAEVLHSEGRQTETTLAQPMSSKLLSSGGSRRMTKPLLKKTSSSCEQPSAATCTSEPEVLSLLSESKTKVAKVVASDKSDMSSPVLIRKIKPSLLPTNQVNTVYCLIDPAAQDADQKRRAAMKNSCQPLCPPVNKKTLSAEAYNVTQTLVQEVQLRSTRDPFSTHQPSLIETMELSNGVVLRQEGRTKRGPKQVKGRETEILSSALRQGGLQPVRVQHLNHSLSAADLLDQHIPVVKPLMETTPIPPINHSSQITSV